MAWTSANIVEGEELTLRRRASNRPQELASGALAKILRASSVDGAGANGDERTRGR